MEIYPVIQLSTQTLMKSFSDYHQAMDYCKGLIANGKRDFFIATYNTEGLLQGFKKQKLQILYKYLELSPKLNATTSKSIAAAILKLCDQPPHLPRKKMELKPSVKQTREDFQGGDVIEDIVQQYYEPDPPDTITPVLFDEGVSYHNPVNLSRKVLENELKRARARASRRLARFNDTPRKPPKIDTLYLKETKKRYKFIDGKPSERFLYHKYILAGVDSDVILQRVSNQLGIKQNLGRYFKYCNELFKLGVIEKVHDFRREEYTTFKQNAN